MKSDLIVLVHQLAQPEFLKIALPALIGIVLWFLNERSKALAAQLQRKEEKYAELIRCLKGFYVNAKSDNLKQAFIDQAGLCWLYAPDCVIQKMNSFFLAVTAGKTPPATDDEKERALGELILAIRTDMLRRRFTTKTRLSHADWRNLNGT